ncbi:aminotransferase class IV, partial [Candidatus Peregrinibacteria bacterium]|nr:aminotransferase class IV [Candidatus Peregrinibacteria bacterium]
MIFFLNGQFVREEQAMVSVKDHGFLYGDGVYETLRTYHGKVWNVKAHIDRLFQSARGILLDVPWKKKEVERWIEETVKRNGELVAVTLRQAQGDNEVLNSQMVRAGRFLSRRQGTALRNDSIMEYKIRVTATRGANHFDFLTTKHPTICIAPEPLLPEPPEVYEKGVSVITFFMERIFPEVKSLNFLPAILARQAAEKKKAYEAIFVNRDCFVTEGTITNVFLVCGDELITPSEGVLGGTTREVILKLAKSVMRVRLRDIAKKELYFADECFLSNTIRGIVPVVKIDGKKIGNGRCGFWTKRLRTAFLTKTG